MEERWNSVFEEVKDFIETTRRLPTLRESNGRWCAQQRRNFREEKLSGEKIMKLESIPEWRWEFSNVRIP
jgi:hypothetical protein